MSGTDLEQILTQRRQAGGDLPGPEDPAVQLVIFSLGKDWFAFPGEAIREILAQAEVFFLPGCPPSLEGVINVRGDLESVVRLQDLLGLEGGVAGAPADGSCILLGRARAMTSGIRVDRVVDVVAIPRSQLQPPPATLPEPMRPSVSGLFSFQGRAVAVLDLERLFAEYERGLG